MDAVLKPISKFVFLIGLMVHLFLIFLFFAPATLLFTFTQPSLSLISADLLSESTVTHYESSQGQFLLDESPKAFHRRVVGAILNLRYAYFMDDAQQAAVDLSRLDYGEGVVGVAAAAEYYYQKNVTELSEAEWGMLIQLHAMFRS